MVKPRQQRVVGWRERADLPELGLSDIKVKIDTGARTSALGVRHLRYLDRDGTLHVSFVLPGAARTKGERVVLPVHDQREIRNTGGVPQERPIVLTRLVIGDFAREIEVSLADRASMKFPMIVGRTALKGARIIVDPARSWRGARPLDPTPVRRPARSKSSEETGR